jgi:hypothetical protein
MKGSFKTALIAAVVSGLVSAGAAVATTQAFTLGTTNRVNAPTSVTNWQSNGTTVNAVDAALLTLDNKSTTANATPLSLLAAPNRAPLKVNTQTKVANLNADQLDGRSSEYFLPKTGKAADSDKLGGQPQSYYLPAAGKAVDSDKLDGLDSASFVRGWEYVVSVGNLGPGEVHSYVAICPYPKRVLGGGWTYEPWNEQFKIYRSVPEGQGNGWYIAARNTGTSAVDVYVWAICASVS